MILIEGARFPPLGFAITEISSSSNEYVSFCQTDLFCPDSDRGRSVSPFRVRYSGQKHRFGMGSSSSHISRGSWGQGPLQQRSAVWNQGPNQQQNAAPLRLRRTVDTGPEAVENKFSTTPRACGTTLRRFQCSALSTAGCMCSVLRASRDLDLFCWKNGFCFF